MNYQCLLCTILILISCSSDQRDVQFESDLDIKRMEVIIRSGESQFIFDNTTYTGVQRNDTLTTSIRAGANLEAVITLFTEADNELRNITQQIQRYSSDYQLFFEPDDLDIVFEYQDSDGNGDPIGLRWNFSTALADRGIVNFKLVKDLDKSNPTFQSGSYDGSSGEVLLDIDFDVKVGFF